MAGESSLENLRDYFRKDIRKDQISHGYMNETDRRNKSLRQTGRLSQCASLGILTDKPKYRQYGSLQSRIDSFVNWPKNKNLEERVLAEAGFVYTGEDDSVRCFFCGTGLRAWPNGACPWEQHVLANPTCGHMIQCKGKGYIKRIIGENNQDSDEDVDDSDDVLDTVQLAIRRNQEAVSAANEYCTDDGIMKLAIKSLIKQDLQRTFSAVELVTVVQEIEERNAVRPENGNQNDTETDGDASDSEEDIEETNRKLKDPVTCKICFDAIACIITLPCGHMFSCSQCISALTKCAICRGQIKGTVRVRMAV